MNATQRKANEDWFSNVKEMKSFLWKDKGHMYRHEDRNGKRVMVATTAQAYNDIAEIVGKAWLKENVVRM